MSVIVKGIKLPKNERYVDIRIFADGRATTATGERPFYREMDVIELPPHGRLVDADRMIKDIKAQLHIVRMLGYKEPVMDEIANEIENGFMQEIANAPTVLEAEEGE